jgi:hypothetical protein
LVCFSDNEVAGNIDDDDVDEDDDVDDDVVGGLRGGGIQVANSGSEFRK